MNDTNKTKEQLIKEISTLKKQLRQHQDKIEQAEEMLIKKEAYSERMDSIGTLAKGIAHHFNNILCGILGYISLMKPQIEASNEFYENICKIEFLAQRASILTKKLLDFAQGKKFLPTPLACTQLLRPNLSLLQHSLDKNISLEINCHCEGYYIMGDEELIRDVILNLCLNAQDAMPHGGKIQIITKILKFNKPHTIEGTKISPGNYFLLQVIDTGKGISQETLNHIFDPFFTTKKIGEGSGLGLAIVYNIMKNHQGYINIQSILGAGTTCTLYFPAFKTKSKNKKTKND